MNETGVDPRSVRESPIAGSWYPGDRKALLSAVQQYLQAVPEQRLVGEVVALVSPHAGYLYSGQVAAHAYAVLARKKYDVVAVISPSHRYYGGDLLVTSRAYYRTPLGLVEVAHDLVSQVGGQVALTFVNRDDEHSLEIQLPFLQVQLGAFRLLPIMMQDQSYGVAKALGDALAKTLADKRALLVASTDLSHFHPYERAVALDRRALAAIERFDAEGLDRDVASGRSEACGYGAVVSVLVAARALGADRVTVLRYANSGDVTGDRTRVVGYGAAAITRSQET